MSDVINEALQNIADAGNPEKEREPIGKVSGFVKKRSPFRRFTDVLFEEDLPTVKKDLVSEVIIPTAKDFIADLFIGAIERALYGSSGGRRAQPSSHTAMSNSLVRSSASYTDYTSAKKQSQPKPVVQQTEKISYKNIVMRTRAKATELVDILRADIARYNNTSVARLYQALTDADDDLATALNVDMDFCDNYYGWTNLDHVPIQRVSNGYWVKFPEPIQLR